MDFLKELLGDELFATVQKKIEEHNADEKKVLKELDKVYAEAFTEIDDKILQLLARDDGNMQNVIYQVEYQKALK